MEEARRDAGLSDLDYIRELNDAVGRNDVRLFTERMEPDVVWEHNPGTGSPEEGVYEGREEVAALFTRLLEGWEYLRPEMTDAREVEPGMYVIHGDLRCKHTATEAEIVEPYEQRAKLRDGRLARMRMLVGSSASG